MLLLQNAIGSSSQECKAQWWQWLSFFDCDGDEENDADDAEEDDDGYDYDLYGRYAIGDYDPGTCPEQAALQ